MVPWLDRFRFFADVLDKIYSGIGPVQRDKLKRAVRTAYVGTSREGPLRLTLAKGRGSGSDRSCWLISAAGRSWSTPSARSARSMRSSGSWSYSGPTRRS